MAAIGPEFVYGVIRKTILAGLVATLASYFAISPAFAGAVAFGTLVSAINLRVVALVIKKMLDAGKGGKASIALWSLILITKMGFLIALIWYLIVTLRLDAVGFAVGFSLFMPAIGWQMVGKRQLVTEDPLDE